MNKDNFKEKEHQNSVEKKVLTTVLTEVLTTLLMPDPNPACPHPTAQTPTTALLGTTSSYLTVTTQGW